MLPVTFKVKFMSERIKLYTIFNIATAFKNKFVKFGILSTLLQYCHILKKLTLFYL